MKKPSLSRQLTHQQGFTLVEMTITVGILTALVALATGMFMSTSQQQNRIRATSVMKAQSQTALFRLNSSLNQARMLMQQDTLGQTYQSNLNLSAAPQPVPSSRLETRLPTIRPEGSLAPEKNCQDSPNSFFRANTVGNALLYARYIGKFSDFGIVDDTTTTTTDESVTSRRTLDIYEFKYIYLSDDRDHNGVWFVDNGLRPNPDMRRLRLIEWTSRKYVDFEQLSDFLADTTSTAVRSRVRSALQDADITHAWRRTGTVYSGGGADIFYPVGTGSGATLSAQTSAHNILQYTAQSLMHYDQDMYSIAYNRQPNSSQPRYFPLINQTPYYYNRTVPDCDGAQPASNTTPANTPTATKNGFPAGFEVMIVGPASGRNVLLRVTTVASSRGKLLVDQADTLTAYARDL